MGSEQTRLLVDEERICTVRLVSRKFSTDRQNNKNLKLRNEDDETVIWPSINLINIPANGTEVPFKEMIRYNFVVLLKYINL